MRRDLGPEPFKPGGASRIYGARAEAYESDRHRPFYGRIARALADRIATRILAGPRDPGAPTSPAAASSSPAAADAPIAVDLGCGTGFSTEAMTAALPALRWSGVDLSGPMLARARDKRLATPVQWIEAAAERLPFEPGSVDLIASSLAFHWFDPEGARREAERVLKPGGMLALAVPLLAPEQETSGHLYLRRLLRLRARARSTNASGLRTAGWRRDEWPERFPGWSWVASPRELRLEESFESADAFLRTLSERGALHASLDPALDPSETDWDWARSEAPAGPIEMTWVISLALLSPPEA